MRKPAKIRKLIFLTNAWFSLTRSHMLYAMFSFDEVYYTKTCCRYHGKIVLCIMFNVQLTRIKVMENPTTFPTVQGHWNHIWMYPSMSHIQDSISCTVMNTCVGVYRTDECVEGGESIIVDALAVVEKFRLTHPHHFSTLVRVPATFHRIHYDRYTVYIHIHCTEYIIHVYTCNRRAMVCVIIMTYVCTCTCVDVGTIQYIWCIGHHISI